ncbi:MAG: adenosine deaminase [Pseudomonadota bacterium]|nr:adenosine deaminase [Pseudomonadota bacterium]
MTDDKIARAPKADLHVHLEGTIEPEMMFRLAARNGITLPYADVAALRAAYDFPDLGAFLAVFYDGLRVMRTQADFYDVTYAFLERSARDNVVYTEIHFSPQSHIERGVAWAEMMDGLLGAMADGLRDFGVTAKPILGLQRHRSEDEALTIIDEAKPYQSDIVALGLGGAERGNPPSKFTRAYAAARAMGWACTCHAGEEGPAEYVTEALDVLGVDRIDHGVRAANDPALTARLAHDRVPMTVCPYSNLRLKVDATLSASALPTLLAAGCNVSMNTDDPSYFGAYLTQNMQDSRAALGLGDSQMFEVIGNGFRGAFCDPATRAGYMNRLAKNWCG